MKLAFVLVGIPLFACATTHETHAAKRADCGELEAREAERGADIYSGPDTDSFVRVVLPANTAVCAEPTASGFGLHRVKLPDGSEGFIRDSALRD